ncbi:Molybdopterin-guanine dinucleotide biosynthesis protein MobA [invertebrate metagenome]|uniref:Molybdopterin-guanine dinucleotide biosynthesis protein MobA n=1 Tax=invertebrate metagenome TaxID=1711999 RepID=A0A484HB34_9ZZZZ
MVTAQETVAIIVAGGRSQRMGGGHKALRPLVGRPIVSHIWAIVAPQVAQLAINVNGPPEDFTTLLPGVLVLADAETDHGPLAGVLAGLCWAAQMGASHLLTIPGDTPFLPSDLVTHMIQSTLCYNATVVCTRSAGNLHPLISLWNVTLISALAAFLATGNRTVRHFLRTCQYVVVDFATMPLDPFMNMNTLADLMAAERIAQNFQCL